MRMFERAVTQPSGGPAARFDRGRGSKRAPDSIRGSGWDYRGGSDSAEGAPPSRGLIQE